MSLYYGYKFVIDANFFANMEAFKGKQSSYILHVTSGLM